MVTMADWRGTILPSTLGSNSIPTTGAPPSPDIRFVVDELWGKGSCACEDLGPLGPFGNTWEQEQGLSWEQVRDSLDDTFGSELGLATPGDTLPCSAYVSESHGASDPPSPEKLQGSLPPDAWSPPAGPERGFPLPEALHSLEQADPWQPQASLAREVREDSSPGTCLEDLRVEPKEAGCHTYSDSASPGTTQELLRRSSLSNVSSLPGLSGNLSLCPESPVVPSSHRSFRGLQGGGPSLWRSPWTSGV